MFAKDSMDQPKCSRQIVYEIVIYYIKHKENIYLLKYHARTKALSGRNS